MNALGTIAAIFLAAFFFTLPLVLKYHVYKPKSKHVLQGDVIILQSDISPVWCQGVYLSSDSKFETYVYDTEPDIEENKVERTWSTHRTVLPNKAHEYWGFHLLKGSKVNLSTCAKLIGGGVTVVKGKSGLKQCIKEHRYSFREKEMSGEDSLSESESEEDTSSISSSQGAIMNDTEALYVCKNSLVHRELPHSYKCSLLSHNLKTVHTMSIELNETGFYYFIFTSKTYLEIIPNEFFIKFTIDRTRYSYAASSSNCSTGFDCNLPITMDGKQKVVVQMKAVNGTLKSDDLLVACKPREWIFFMFYAAFLLVVFICAFQ